jgi:hypothetical protein
MRGSNPWRSSTEPVRVPTRRRSDRSTRCPRVRATGPQTGLGAGLWAMAPAFGSGGTVSYPRVVDDALRRTDRCLHPTRP